MPTPADLGLANHANNQKVKSMKTLLTLIFLLGATLNSSAQPASNPYLKKYAGTYRMVANGQKITKQTDRYVLASNGSCIWTIFVTTKADGTVSHEPQQKPGKWTASEGLIQIFIDGFGEGELQTDFKFEGGVFKGENVYLKKEVTLRGK